MVSEKSRAIRSSELVGDNYVVTQYSHDGPAEGRFEVCLYSLTSGSLRWKRRCETISAPLTFITSSYQELILADTHLENSVFTVVIIALAISTGETIAETRLEVSNIGSESNVNRFGPLLFGTLNTLKQERIGFLVDLQRRTIIRQFPTEDRFLISACRNSETSFALLVKRGQLIELRDSADYGTVKDRIDDSDLSYYPARVSPPAFVTPETLYYVPPGSMRIERFKHGLNLPTPVFCTMDLSSSGRYLSVLASSVGIERLGIVDLVGQKTVFSSDVLRKSYEAADPDNRRICYLRSIRCKLGVEIRDFDNKRLSTIAL